MRLTAIATLLAAAGLTAFAAPAALAGDACPYSASKASMAKAKHTGDIVHVAADAGQFSTLLAAAKAAGLAETLAGEGPYTVFAPTDDAFAKLPAGTVDHLLANPDQLKQILLFHVMPGKLTAEKALDAGKASTAFGQPVAISVKDGQAFVNGAKIIKTDVAASNGVIHVIDSVILPKDIVGVAASDDRFSTLVAAVKAAGLAETLQGDGPFTVFAPTNDAFAALPAGTVETLLKPENKAKLVDILTYHVAAGAVPSDQVVKLDAVKTLQGKPVDVKVKKWGDKTAVKIGDAKVLITDIRASNGVIHVIDSVLLPPDETAMAD